MNKRLLRKFPVSSADENIFSSAQRLRESSIEYIISGQGAQLGGAETLVLSFFEIESVIKGGMTPEFRVFLADGDYIT